jgi:glycosyltransferase involved in cell wall biosynthesis
MKRFVKIVPNDFVNASRDKRELSVVAEFGYEIIVVAKGEKKNSETVDGHTIHYLSTRPLGDFKPAVKLNRLLSLFVWAAYVRGLKADCISCHDLTALIIGWLSILLIPDNKRPKLVYDSHEFEIGRNKKRSEFIIYLITTAERFLIKKCAVSMMVNDSIADEVQKIHALEKRPAVVRNVPNLWIIDNNLCDIKHKEFCEKMKMPEDTFIVMYHGRIVRNRGIENMLFAVQKINSVAAVILGNPDTKYVDELKLLIKDLKLENRVLFHEAVPLQELWQYVGAADAGIVTISNTCRSYYLSLPNKFFENIQAETPVIVSDFPELARLVKKYEIGLCCDPNDIDDIADKIEYLKNNPEIAGRFRNNMKTAKLELCWEKESQNLFDAYSKIL